MALEKFSSKLLVTQFMLTNWNRDSVGQLECSREAAVKHVEALELQEAATGLDHIGEAALKSAHNKLLALNRKISLKWKSKARIKWLSQGDCNSAFFHKVTMIRRRKNKISYGKMVRILRILLVFNLHFVLFMLHRGQNLTLLLRMFFNKSTCRRSRMKMLTLSLTGIINEGEIRRTMLAMATGKAPGPDGFHMEFYKKSWSILGPSFLKALTEFQRTFTLPRSWGLTHLCFIPKKHNPEKVNDFRPISLCNTSYRILSKLLALRLANILPTHIGKEQSAFVAGRAINDNILLVVAHSMSTYKRNKSIILMKIDIEKSTCFSRLMSLFLFIER